MKSQYIKLVLVIMISLIILTGCSEKIDTKLIGNLKVDLNKKTYEYTKNEKEKQKVI